jgi:hypothetical protein
MGWAGTKVIGITHEKFKICGIIKKMLEISSPLYYG